VTTLSPKVVLPLAVLLLGVVGGTGLIAIEPKVETSDPVHELPVVRAMHARLESAVLRIDAQGTVVPRTESDLVAEVSGRVIWMSPSLASGGFIEADEPLVRIDPRDYRVALRRAEASLERAASERELARSGLERRSNLRDRGVASNASLDDARNAARVAEAAHWDALAGLEQARRNLERAEIRAPFAGRVREKRVDVGQFIARGAPVARVYAVDYAEVRLPIPDSDAAYVDLPFAYRDDSRETGGPAVELRARFAGREYRWKGRIVRTEGEIDPRTRMIHAVARVENPYARGDGSDRPPLAVGLFVRAEIEGRVVDDAVKLPRSALRGHDEVVVVEADDRLRSRQVVVLQRGDEQVLVQGGIRPGERVVTSPLPLRIDGMSVRVEVAPGARTAVPLDPEEPAPATARPTPETDAAGRSG